MNKKKVLNLIELGIFIIIIVMAVIVFFQYKSNSVVCNDYYIEFNNTCKWNMPNSKCSCNGELLEDPSILNENFFKVDMQEITRHYENED